MLDVLCFVDDKCQKKSREVWEERKNEGKGGYVLVNICVPKYKRQKIFQNFDIFESAH